MSGRNGGPPGPRQERGDAAGSHRDPPHVDVNARDAEVQASSASPRDVPTLPANAHGSDRAEGGEQPRSIDHESAYEGRREEHKDHTSG